MVKYRALKGQNLQGFLPPELNMLPYLQKMYVIRKRFLTSIITKNIIELVSYFQFLVSIYYFAWHRLSPFSLSITVTFLATTWTVQFLNNGAPWILLTCIIFLSIILLWFLIIDYSIYFTSTTMTNRTSFCFV